MRRACAHCQLKFRQRAHSHEFCGDYFFCCVSDCEPSVVQECGHTFHLSNQYVVCTSAASARAREWNSRVLYAEWLVRVYALNHCGSRTCSNFSIDIAPDMRGVRENHYTCAFYMWRTPHTIFERVFPLVCTQLSENNACSNQLMLCVADVVYHAGRFFFCIFLASFWVGLGAVLCEHERNNKMQISFCRRALINVFPRIHVNGLNTCA